MHRMPDPEAGEVIPDVRLAQHRCVRRDAANVLLQQRDPSSDARQVLALAVHEVVDHDDRRTRRRELANQLGADEPGPSRDDLHPSIHQWSLEWNPAARQRVDTTDRPAIVIAAVRRVEYRRRQLAANAYRLRKT